MDNAISRGGLTAALFRSSGFNGHEWAVWMMTKVGSRRSGRTAYILMIINMLFKNYRKVVFNELFQTFLFDGPTQMSCQFCDSCEAPKAT
jgi:hypothetical protein